MNCHKLIWNDSPMLEPVRASYRTGEPIEWTRIHDLPDFVYFNHSIHVAKGVGCETCHGRVDQMPLMYQHASLQMEWCLECHRNPGSTCAPGRRSTPWAGSGSADDPSGDARAGRGVRHPQPRLVLASVTARPARAERAI